MEQLVSFVVVGALAGLFAQGWKGHIGAVWGLISLPITYFWYEVFFRTVRNNPTTVSPAVDPYLVVAVASGAFGLISMLIIVATLPKRRRGD